MKKIALITGITGQDGAYLARFLLEKDYTVVGVIRNNHSSNYKNLTYLKIGNRIVFEECDLRDLPYVIRTIERYNPDEIYNLAAQSSVGLSFQQPTATITYNILSVLNLLEAIRIVNDKIKFYQASSSEMYGKVNHLPITLDTPMHPLSPYAISKASSHWTVANFRESFGLFASAGILFNHESHLRSKNFFVKKVIIESLRIKAGVQSKLKLGNIDVRRDFGFAPKYVEAMWLILQQDSPSDFIICSGKSISLREVVEHVFNRLDIDSSKMEYDASLKRPAEIEDIYGDNSRSKILLNWSYDLDFKAVLDQLVEEEIQSGSI